MSDPETSKPTDTRIGYAIRINGKLGATFLEAFPELEPAFEDGHTVLTGELEDQPALHGVLAQIEALGLELVEVRRASGDKGDRHAAREYNRGKAQSQPV